MATDDNAFGRVPIGFRELPVSDDHNRAASINARTLAYLWAQFIGARATDDSEAASLRDIFHGVGLQVIASNPAAMSVQVLAGLGWHYLPSDTVTDLGSPDLVGVDDLSPIKPIPLVNAHTFAVPTAPVAPNTRIDIVEVRADRHLIDSETRRQLNTATGAFDPHDFYKTLGWAVDGLVGSVTSPANSTQPLSYKVGVAANPGTVPATSPGYIKLAEILVGSGVASITNSVIIDRRKLAAPDGLIRASVRYGIEWNGGVPITSIAGALTPPGVRYAVKGLNTGRSNARIYFVAGEISRASVRSQIRPTTYVANGTEAFATIQLPILVGGDMIQTVDAGLQAALAAATPAINVGIGQKVIAVEVQGRYMITGGTINQSNASLESITGDVVVELAYTP